MYKVERKSFGNMNQMEKFGKRSDKSKNFGIINPGGPERPLSAACTKTERKRSSMWREQNRALFLACLNDLEKDPFVCQLKRFRQHTAATTRYDHCLCVAYFSFTLCRWLGWDYKAAARAGMLHDLYLDEWEGSEDGTLARWRTHPRAALENARRYGLSRREEDIIVNHMFPLTLTLPRYKESYVVSTADKIAAVLEKTHLATPLGIRKSCRMLALATERGVSTAA